MADNTATFKIEIELEQGNYGQQISGQIERMRGEFAGVDREINKVQKSLEGVSDAAQKQPQVIQGWSQSLSSVWREQFKAEQATMATKAAQDQLNNSYRDAEGLASRLGTVEQERAALAEQSNKRVGSSFGAIVDESDKANQQASRSYSNLSTQIDSAIEARARESAIASQSIRARMEEQVATEKAAAANEKNAQSLSTTRYALYDVSQTLGVAAAAMLGLAAVTSGTAIAFERDFANVVRTVGSEIGYTNPLIDELRTNLIDLSTTIPVSFRELTEIATLGGQLGIAATGIDEFTEVVAKLGATTDLTFEQAGTAIGRFAAILQVPESEFNNLASAILKVGVNSVATETQIVNISTQISSMGAYAGLTAEQVVGLSGALASVGAQPELSRGTITRTFTQMSKAITEGGERLEAFARISGVSASEFSSAFGTSRFAGVFQQFIGGLGDMQRSGEDANMAIRELGITSVRDVPLLLRLGLAQQTVRDAFADSASGYRDATELNEQYGVIAQTTAAKLTVLTQSVQALIASIGEGTSGPIGAFAERLTEITKAITAFTSTPGGQIASAVVVGLLALAGTIALVGAAAARGFASIVGMQQALAGLTGSSTAATIGLKGLQGQLAATGTAGAVAARGLGAATVAAKALSAAFAVFASIEIANWIGKGFAEINYAIEGLDRDTTATFSRLKNNMEEVGTYFELGGFIGGIQRALAPVSNDTILQDIQRLDTELANMVNGGNIEEARRRYDELRRSWVQAGNDASQFSVAFVDTTKALETAANAAPMAGGAFDELAEPIDEATAAAEQLALALGIMPEELEALESALSSGSGKFFDFSKIVEKAYDDMGGGIEEFIEKLGEQLAAQEAWATNVSILTARGATNFVTQLAEMGPAGAKLAADAVNLTADELAALEGQVAQSVQLSSDAWSRTLSENTPLLAAAYRFAGDEGVRSLQEALQKGDAAVVEQLKAMQARIAENPLEIYANGQPAIDVLNAIQREINSRTGTITIYGQYSDGTLQMIRDPASYGRNVSGDPHRANGGYISGPGTGTSDSIRAWLSNGEYVIRASSVQKYGTAFMNAINAGNVPKFASGGQVGSSAPSMMGGVVELGPKSLARLSREVVNRISIDQRSIANAANAGNAQNSWKGGLG